MGAGSSVTQESILSEASEKPAVIYFDAPGLGEFIRLAFVAGGVEFEDVRLTKEQWGEYKSKTPYGNLPVIVDKGRVVGQSLGCARLAAKRAGIYPSDDVDAGVVDSIMDTTKELIEVARAAGKVEGDEAKTAAMMAFVTKDFKDAAVAFAAILAGKDFLVGADKGSLSLADIVVYYLCNGLLASRMPDKDQFMGMLKQIGIGDLIERVGDLPKIKEWNEKCAAAAEAKAQAEN